MKRYFFVILSFVYLLPLAPFKIFGAELTNLEVMKGGKEDYWQEIDNLAYANFLSGNYETASKYYKKWLKKDKKEWQILNEKHDFSKKDPYYINKPQAIDLVFAIETFIRLKDYSGLNLIPRQHFYYRGVFEYPEKTDKINLKSWSVADSDYDEKMNLLNIIESFINRTDVQMDYREKGHLPEYLKNLKSLELFYSLDTEPDADHSYFRSKYYGEIGDKEKERAYLKRAADMGNYNANLLMLSNYYYATDEAAKDQKSVSGYLKNIETTINNSFQNIGNSDYLKGAYILAMLYYSDESGIKDYEKAFEYALKYQNKNDQLSKTPISGEIYELLSKCYRFGRGGAPIDIAKADQLALLATECGGFNADKNKIILEWLNNDSESN